MNLQKAEFLTSLTDLSKLPKDGLLSETQSAMRSFRSA